MRRCGLQTAALMGTPGLPPHAAGSALEVASWPLRPPRARAASACRTAMISPSHDRWQ